MLCLTTSMLFACPALKFNEVVSKFAPIYAYEFSDESAPGYLLPTSFELCAAHTYEIPCLFANFIGDNDNADTSLNFNQEKLSFEMIKEFGSFYKNGSKFEAFNVKKRIS